MERLFWKSKFSSQNQTVIKLAAGKVALHAPSCLKQILKHDLVPALPYIQLLPLFLAPPTLAPFPYPRGEPYYHPKKCLLSFKSPTQARTTSPSHNPQKESWKGDPMWKKSLEMKYLSPNPPNLLSTIQPWPALYLQAARCHTFPFNYLPHDLSHPAPLFHPPQSSPIAPSLTSAIITIHHQTHHPYILNPALWVSLNDSLACFQFVLKPWSLKVLSRKLYVSHNLCDLRMTDTYVI